MHNPSPFFSHPSRAISEISVIGNMIWQLEPLAMALAEHLGRLAAIFVSRGDL